MRSARSSRSPPAVQLKGERDEAIIRALTHPEPVPHITLDMRLDGIHHVSAITDDLDRAGEFIESGLGLRLVKKTRNQDDPEMLHYFWASYSNGAVAPRSSLTLFGWPSSGHPTQPGTGQTHHIAFRAADRDEQRAWRDRLLTLGVEVTQVLDRFYFRSIYFRAPDGLLCEIATDGPGFALDEPGGALGRDLKLPAWLEPDRPAIERGLAELPPDPA